MQSFPLKLPKSAWKPGSKFARSILPQVIDETDPTKPVPESLRKFLAAHEKHAATELALEDVERKRLGATEEEEDGGKRLNCNLLLQIRALEEDPYDVVELSLAGYALKQVDTTDAWGYFRKLEVLDLAENELDFALMEQVQLPMLTSLSLACNNISSFQLQGIGFFTLQVLDLSFNSIRWQSLGELRKIPQLRLLNLAGNQLTDLPKDFRMCMSLEMVVLDDNKLSGQTGIEVLGQLPSLRRLHIRKNRLSQLPRNVHIMRSTSVADLPNSNGTPKGGHNTGSASKGKLMFKSLEELDVALNQFTNVDSLAPPLLDGYPALTAIDVSGNPILTRRKKAQGLAQLEHVLQSKTPRPIRVIVEELDDWKGTGGGGGLAVKKMAKKKAENARRATVARDTLVHVPEPEFFPSFRQPSKSRGVALPQASSTSAMKAKRQRDEIRRQRLAEYEAMAQAAEEEERQRQWAAEMHARQGERPRRRRRRRREPRPVHGNNNNDDDDDEGFFVTGGGLEVQEDEYSSEYYSSDDGEGDWGPADEEPDPALLPNGAVNTSILSVWELEDRLRAAVADAKPPPVTDKVLLTSQLRKALTAPRVHPTVLRSKKQPGVRATHQTRRTVSRPTADTPLSQLDISGVGNDTTAAAGGAGGGSGESERKNKNAQVSQIEDMLSQMRSRLAHVEANLGAALDGGTPEDFPESNKLLHTAESHYRKALEQAIGEENTG